MKFLMSVLFLMFCTMTSWCQMTTNYSITRSSNETVLTITKSKNGSVISEEKFYGEVAEAKYSEFSKSISSSNTSSCSTNKQSNKVADQSPSGSSQNSGSTFSYEDINSILKAHNKERRVLGESDLTWNSNIATYAQEWAEYLAGRDRGLTHRKSDGYGENIAMHYVNSASYGVDLWNEEKSSFVYEPIGNNYANYGHYSQVIWKNTTEVGCGLAQGSSGARYFVCNYNPPGNYIGQKPY